MAKRKPPEIKDDPRVTALANCVVFAINSFKDKPVMDTATNQMGTWHTWFKRILTEAGYTVTEPPKPEK